ncbi:MAG: rhomboid family intramembrane serine protease [Candidatus Nanoarchaeia archaeon]
MFNRRRNSNQRGIFNSSQGRFSQYRRESTSQFYTILLCITLSLFFILQFTGVVDANQYLLNTQEVVNFNLLTTFTSLFFHVGALHFISNIIALYIFSRKVEQEVGVGTLFLFIIGGIIANGIVSIHAGIIGEHYLSVGASAGIAPLIFFVIIAKPISLLTPLAWFIILFDILNLSNQNTTTNHAVHVTGYLAAFILMSILNFKNKRYIYYSIGFNLVGLILLYIGLTMYYF